MRLDFPFEPKVERVMWLGGPSGHTGTWEEMVEKSIKERLKEPLEALTILEEQIHQHLIEASRLAEHNNLNNVATCWTAYCAATTALFPRRNA
eukprot:203158-Prorocentrum_lima.AAC.1